MIGEDKMEIEFFATPDGERPAMDFLEGLSPKMQAKMLDKIRYLHELGPALRLPHSRHLEDEIYELRAQAEGNISRILYFFVIGDKAVLTHGFVKKTQHTPQKEIKRAEKYRRQYLLQHHIKG